MVATVTCAPTRLRHATCSDRISSASSGFESARPVLSEMSDSKPKNSKSTPLPATEPSDHSMSLDRSRWMAAAEAIRSGQLSPVDVDMPDAHSFGVDLQARLERSFTRFQGHSLEADLLRSALDRERFADVSEGNPSRS